MTDKNPCIKTTVVTVLSKKVIEGTIVGTQWGGRLILSPQGWSGVYIRANGQVFSKDDLKHLIDSLTEVHEEL